MGMNFILFGKPITEQDLVSSVCVRLICCVVEPRHPSQI